jgi:hypothetical protein
MISRFDVHATAAGRLNIDTITQVTSVYKDAVACIGMELAAIAVCAAGLSVHTIVTRKVAAIVASVTAPRGADAMIAGRYNDA